MNDLQIHSLSKRSARDMGALRTVLRVEGRNFERQLLRAAKPDSTSQTTPRRSDLSSASSKREAVPQLDNYSGRRQENEEPDGTEQAVVGSVQLATSHESQVQPRDVLELTKSEEGIAETQPVGLAEAVSATEEVVADSVPLIAESFNSLELSETTQVSASRATNENTASTIDQRSAIKEPIGETENSIFNERSQEQSNSPNVEVAEISESGETNSEKNTDLSLDQSGQPVPQTTVTELQMPSQVDVAPVEGANSAKRPSHKASSRKNEEFKEEHSSDAETVLVSDQREGRPGLQRLTEQTLTDASLRGEEQSNSDSKSTDQSSIEPIAAQKNEFSSLFQRLASGRTTIGLQGESQQAEGEPRVDVARFVGRVAGAFRVANERGGVLQLRLSPPELGAMKLELIVERGALTARIKTETTTARKVLLDNLPALRDRLAQQDIRIERFDVDVRRDGAGSQPDWQAGERQERRFQPDQRQVPRRAPASSESSAEVASQPSTSLDGCLNVFA